MCLRKLKRFLIAPTPKPDPLPSITINSMEAPITNHVGPIVIEGPVSAAVHDESTSVVADVEREKRAE